MKRVDEIIADIIRREGSQYTDRPSDSGGPTKFGITQRTLGLYRGSYATAKDVQALTEGEAKRIYEKKYINDPGFLSVLAISEPVAAELVDTGVNCGPPRAVEFFQRSLNALNRCGRDYPDIPVDHECGPRTVQAYRALVATRGRINADLAMLRALNCLQGAHYISLAEKRPKDEDFVYGWLMNRVEV